MTPAFNGWGDLTNEDFCKKTFDIGKAVLKKGATTECEKAKPNWASVIEDVDEEFLSSFQEWASSLFATSIHISVYVGYAWDSEEDVRKDEFWCSLRNILTDTTKKLQEFYKDSKALISVKRLHASHGGSINKRIVEYIENADVLIFDIAGRGKDLPKGTFAEGFNANVLYELGQAMARKEEGKIFLWKPEGPECPSDLSCYLWTEYKLSENKSGKMIRTLVDRRGFSAQFRSVLVDCIREKLQEREAFRREQVFLPSATESDS